MAKSTDRPGGMDQLQPNFVAPTAKTPPMKNEMPAFAKVASGPVDSGQKGKFTIPSSK